MTLVPDAMHSIWNEQLKADPTLHPSPVNFTKLRYEGICRVLCDAGEECKNYAEEALSVFLSARNDVERMLFPDALATLNALKDRGIRLCAITNGNADVMSIPCFANMFEFCISAEQVGSSKPDIGPFMAALSKAGYSSVDTTLENNDCLWIHVGDDPHSDCLGAHKVGMIAVLIRPPCYSSSKNTIEQKDMNVFSGCVGSNQDVKPNHIHHELGCLSELIYLVDEYNMINHH